MELYILIPSCCQYSTSKSYLLSISLKKCNKITLWALHYKCQDAFFLTNKSVFSSALMNLPTGKPTKNCAKTDKNRWSDFSTGPSVYLQLNRRENDERKIDRRKTGFVKRRSVFLPVQPNCVPPLGLTLFRSNCVPWSSALGRIACRGQYFCSDFFRPNQQIAC